MGYVDRPGLSLVLAASVHSGRMDPKRGHKSDRQATLILFSDYMPDYASGM